jgi:chaperone required for assembly of F1-ATPase
MKVEPSESIQPPKVELNPQFLGWLEGLNNWQLIGLETMVIWMRSTIAAVAVVESGFDPSAIQRAAYLEEATQMKGSGEVE